MALAGLGKIGGVGPSGDLPPSPRHPQVAGTEEPQIERAVSPENGLLGVLFCGGPDVEAEEAMTKGEVLKYAIAFALRRSRKITRGLKEGLTEEGAVRGRRSRRRAAKGTRRSVAAE
jgi:hypothetical protein